MEGKVWAALHYVDPLNPVNPLDPAACPKLVFHIRKTLLLPLEKPWGASLGAEKAPAGMGTRKTQHMLGSVR